MASALQRLFRKRAKARQDAQNSQQQQELHQQLQQRQQAASASASSAAARKRYTISAPLSSSSSSIHSPSSSFEQQSRGAPLSPTLTVSSLASYRSPESSSSHHFGAYARPRAHSIDQLSALGRASSNASHHRIPHDEFGRMSLVAAADAVSVSASQSGAVDNASTSDADEDDFDENPLYQHLSEGEEHRSDWEAARLVLLPPARELRASRAPLEDSAWAALHALQPSPTHRDQFVSVRHARESKVSRPGTPPHGLRASDPVSPTSARQDLLRDAMAYDVREAKREPSAWDDATVTAKLAGGRSVHITFSRAGQEPVELVREVMSEVVVYRTQARAPSPAPPRSDPGFQVVSRPSTAPAGREKIRIRVLMLSGLVVPNQLQRGGSVAHPSAEPSPAGSIAFPTTALSDEGEASHDADRTAQLSLSNEVFSAAAGGERGLLADVLLLRAPPSTLVALAPTLRLMYAAMERAASSLRNSYVLVPGFEGYDSVRIRRGVVVPAMEVLDAAPIRLASAARSRLAQACENVAMGLLHGRLYATLRDSQREVDESVDALLSIYSRSGASGTALGITVQALRARPARLDGAVASLKSLGIADLDSDALLALPVPALAALRQDSSPPNVRTPQDVLAILRKTLSAIGDAAASASVTSSRASLSGIEAESTPLGADELLPIVVSVIVRARPQAMPSCLAYAKMFGLMEGASAEARWALTTFEAALEWLRGDPLRLLPAVSSDAKSSDGHGLSRNSSVRSATSSSHAAPSSSQLSRPPLTSTYSSGSWSTSSEARARRVSLPAGAHLGTSVSMARSGSSQSRSGNGSAEERPSSPEVSALRSNDGFKVPGLPASLAGSARSRGSRPQSMLGILGEDLASNDSAADLARDRTFSLQRQGSAQSGSHPALHIRPQIVRRKPISSAASSAGDRALAIERAASLSTASATSPTVRVMGSPLIDSNQAMSRAGSESGVQVPRSARRMSVDGWSAMSLFTRAASEEAVSSGSMPTAASSAAHASSARETHQQQRSLSPDGSSASHGGRAESPALSGWLPAWPDFSSGSKRASTSLSRPASISSLEGGMSASSTFSTIPRSNSGSGFALDNPAVVSRGAQGSLPSRRAISIHSAVSFAGDESMLASSPTSIAPMPVPGIAERRRRISCLMSPTAPALAQQAPAPQLASQDVSAAGDFSAPRTAEGLDSAFYKAIVAASGSPTTNTEGFSPTSSAPPSLVGTPSYVHSRGHTTPLSGSNTPSTQHGHGDSFFPFLRLSVPSPVSELADPMASGTPVMRSHRVREPSPELLSPTAARAPKSVS